MLHTAAAAPWPCLVMMLNSIIEQARKPADHQGCKEGRIQALQLHLCVVQDPLELACRTVRAGREKTWISKLGGKALPL